VSRDFNKDAGGKMNMRRGFWIVPLALLLFGAPVYAAFDTSHHDLRTYVSSAQGCYHCHGRVATATVDNAVINGAGAVGALCLYRCHAIAGIFTADPGSLQPDPPSYPQDNGTYSWVNPAPDYNAVRFDRSHGSDMSVASTVGAGYPYNPTGATSGNIQCTSCHSVHDDTNSPFIWRQMGKDGTTAGLCSTCHSAYAGSDLTGLPNGNHPVDFVVDTTAAASRNSGSTPFRTQRHGRLISIDGEAVFGAGNHVFDVSTPAGATLRAAAGTPNTSWITGGKMWNGPNNYGNFVSGTSKMGCYTCHSAHRTTGGGSNYLTVMAIQDLAVGYNPICVGCHGSANSWAANKSDWNMGVTAYGHPVGDNTQNTGTPGQYTTSAGGFTFSINLPAGAQFGNQGELLCLTCHDVHGGVAGSMAIRNLGQGTTRVVCKSCHNGVGFPNVNDVSKGGTGEPANSHHRTTTQSISTPTSTYAPINEAGANMQVNTPSWASTAPLGLGDLSSGMDCADCHIFNGTAHNW